MISAIHMVLRQEMLLSSARMSSQLKLADGDLRVQ